MDVKKFLRESRAVKAATDERFERERQLEELLEARKRQRERETRKRAAEVMANLNEAGSETKSAEVTENTPRPQPLLYQPTSSEITISHADSWKKLPDRYYPYPMDFVSMRPTVNPNTMLANWGETVGRQLFYKNAGRRIAKDYVTKDAKKAIEYQSYYEQAMAPMTPRSVVGHETNGETDITDNAIAAAKIGITAASRLINPFLGPIAGIASEAMLDKNRIAHWNINKNEAEVSTYAGDIARNTELRGYLLNIAEYQNAAENLLNVLRQLRQLQSDPSANQNDIATLRLYETDLKQQLPRMQRAAEIASTYLDKITTDQNESTRRSYTTSGGAIPAPIAYNNGGMVDRKTINGYIEQLKNSLNTAGDADEKTVSSILSQMDKYGSNYINKLDREDAESREGMRKNLRELNNWKKWHTPDAEYMKRAETAIRDMSFLDPDTYLYGLPGVLGSSASFNGILLAAQALQLGGGLLTSSGTGAIIGVPMVGAGAVLNMASGTRENAAEVWENVSQVYQDRLQKTGRFDDFLTSAEKLLGKKVDFNEAMQAMALGEFTPSEALKKEFVNSTVGAHNLFMHDMAATTADTMIDTAINFVPFGKIANATILKPLGLGSRIGKLRRLVQFKEAHPNIYKTAAFLKENGSEGWSNFGASISPVLGPVATAIGAATKPLRSKAVNAATKFAAEQLEHKFGNIANWATKAPKTLLNTKAIGNSAKDWLSRVIGTSFSEAIEEGKQYYNGKQFAAGNYAGESDSLIDLVLGDIEGGSKSALQFTGSFLGLTSDKEWLANMRGGFLAGGGHTAVISGVGNASGLYKQVYANNVVINNILATKLAERSQIAKAQSYAKRISAGDKRAMHMAFDNFSEMLEDITRRGEEIGDPEMIGISREDINEQRELYDRIYNVANSEAVRSAAKARGIRPGSDKYATYVALIDFARQNKQSALEPMLEKLSSIESLLNQSVYDSNVNDMSDERVNLLINQLGLYNKEAEQDFVTAPITDGNARWQQTMAFRRNQLQNRINVIDYFAHLDALLSYRDQLELKDDKTSADRRKLRVIKREIENLRNSVKTRTSTIDENGNESYKLQDNALSMISTAPLMQQYIDDLDLHEVIRDQYRDIINYQIDFDNASAMEFNLMGNVSNSEIQGNEIIDDFINRSTEQLNRQNKTTSNLVDNKDVLIKDGNISYVDIDQDVARRANKVINDYLSSVKADEEFEQEIHDDMERGVRRLIEDLREENVEEVEQDSSESAEPEAQRSPYIRPEINIEEREQQSDESFRPEILIVEEEVIENTEDALNKKPQIPEGTPSPTEIVPEPIILPEPTVAPEPVESQATEPENNQSDGREYIISDETMDELRAKLRMKLRGQLNANPFLDPELYTIATRLAFGHIERGAVKFVDFAKKMINDFGEVCKPYLKVWYNSVRDMSTDQAFYGEMDSYDEVMSTDLDNLDADNLDKVIQRFYNTHPLFSEEFLESVADDQISQDVRTKIENLITSYKNELESSKETEGFEDTANQQLMLDTVYTYKLQKAQEYIDAVNAEYDKINAEQSLSTPLTSDFITDADITDSQEVSSEESRTKAQFSTETVDDLSYWGLLTNVLWSDPRHPGEDVSTSASEDGTRLVNVIGNEDFIESATFELILQNNNLPFVRITYQGKTFNPIFIATAHNQNRSRGYAFWSELKNKFGLCTKQQMVVPLKVSRSQGKERRTNDSGQLVEPRLLTDVGLITPDNMYTLTFDENQTTFGMTQEYTDPTTGALGIRIVAPFGGLNARNNAVLYIYPQSERGDHPAPGIPIFLFDRKFKELGDRKTLVPINTVATRLSQGDASLITEILTGAHCENDMLYGTQILAAPYIERTENGQIINYGATNGDILNFLLRYWYKFPADRRRVHVEFNPDDTRRIRIVGNIEDAPTPSGQLPAVQGDKDQSNIPYYEFNLYDENQRNMFELFCQNMLNRPFEKTTAQARVGDSNETNVNNPFSRLAAQVKRSLALQLILKQKGEIRFGNSSIVFDSKDFAQDGVENSQGVSGIVWYMRHGFFTTRFNGFENTLLVFDEDAGMAIVQRGERASQDAEQQSIEQTEKLVDNAVTEDEWNEITPQVAPITASAEEVNPDGQNKARRQRNKARRQEIPVDDDIFFRKGAELPSDRIDLDQAKAEVHRLLGTIFHVEELGDHKGMSASDLQAVLQNGPVVFGTCSSAIIRLSKYAERGTEYHEAFHAVCEFLLSDKKRQKIYEAYGKQKHIDISTEAGMKAVTEGLADEFMMWMKNTPTIKGVLSWERLRLNIRDWLGIINDQERLYKLYLQINSGKFRNTKPSNKKLARVKSLLDKYDWKEFNYKIGDTPLEAIFSASQFRNLCNSLVFMIHLSEQQLRTLVRQNGEVYNDVNLDNVEEVRNLPQVQKYIEQKDEDGEYLNLGLREMLEKWDLVKDKIKSQYGQYGISYVGQPDSKENLEDAQGDEESIAEAAFGDYTKASYEFARFKSASKRVKQFFSVIPDVKWIYNLEGKRTKVYVTNSEGLPQFMKALSIYNIVLNQTYGCKSLAELLAKTQKLGEENAKFNIVYERLKQLANNAANGNVDDAALLTQICVNLHASKGSHVLCKTIKSKDGKYDIVIQATDGSHASQNYRAQWSEIFAGGASKFVGIDKDGKPYMKGKFKPTVFRTLGKYMNDLVRALSPAGINTNATVLIAVKQDGQIGYRNLDVKNPEDLRLAKVKLVNIMNGMGINISIDALNNALETEYGSSDHTALYKYLQGDSRNSLEKFAAFISSFSVDGKLNIDYGDNGWTLSGKQLSRVFFGGNTGFVNKLANAEYQYKKTLDLLSVLGNKSNRLYLISSNNWLTDTKDELNDVINGNTKVLDDRKQFVYNYLEDGTASALFVKHFEQENPQQLELITDAGFKTDDKNDLGNDYADITKRQDSVTKITALLDGYMVLPTMADKKTWYFLRGMRMPGLDFKTGLAGQHLNTFENIGGRWVFSQDEQVLEQLRQYALMEHEAVLQTLAQVKGYRDAEGVVHPPLTEDQKVKNYHKASVKVNGKKYTIIQGARYSTLYSVYDNNNKKISFNRVCDKGGRFVTEEENIKTAMEYFFGVPSENEGMYWIRYDGEYQEVTADRLREIQYKLIQKNLHVLLNKQLNSAVRLGIIKRINSNKYGFKNVLLDKSKVQSVMAALPNAYTTEQKETMAVMILMNDVSCKSIISLQESERMFSGHPAFYKWGYNSAGVLADRSTDQYKRFGGLISTGDNNAFVFPNMPTTYKVAEINDVEVASKYADEMRNNIYEGELRSAYIINSGKNDGDSLSIEELEKWLKENNLYDNVAKTANEKADAFVSGINVADGATYITDDMFENLLKMNGNYSKEVENAFKLLRSEPVNGQSYSEVGIRTKLAAWQRIMDEAFVTQKYTAYGMRNQNGVNVPYFHKTALFPLFRSMCTGNTVHLYDKMKAEGVDMVAFTSAVKVGSQGAQDIMFDNFSKFHFNTYELEYKNLRKQLNTDPKEDELLAMGTQASKVAMAHIMPNRMYYITDVDGTQRLLDADGIRDEIMNCINTLAKLGNNSIRSKLFTGDKLDITKFAKTMRGELADRGAGTELLDALSIVERDGKLDTKIPLPALFGMDWIQSIVVSQVNKAVIDITTPGAAFIQRSVFGMEGLPDGEQELLKTYSLYEGRDLLVRNENGSMDCFVSIDFFRDILPPNLSFEESRMWLIENGVISGRDRNGEWHDADAQIMSYRIPTQAISSIHALRVADVLPVIRDTIVLPKEFTKITGSDFDVDKLFLSRYFYDRVDQKDADGKVIGYTLNKTFSDNSKKGAANKLLADYIALLKDSKSHDDSTPRTANYGDTSIDRDTQMLLEIVRDLDSSAVKEDLDVYDNYSLWNNTDTREAFISGKFGIGPFALNNNSLILTLLYDVSFNPDKVGILAILDKTSLSNSNDQYGNSILSALSGLINAHVDVAKDPYISRLNVNKYTYNLVNLLVRTGFGKLTFYFTTQPIMKELANAVNNAESSFGSGDEKSPSKRKDTAEKGVLLELLNQHLPDVYKKAIKSPENIGKIIEDHLMGMGYNITAIYKSIFDKESDILRQSAKDGVAGVVTNKYLIETEKGTQLLNYADLQLIVYLAKSEFNIPAQSLSSLVKYLKIDTKKQGKSISELMEYLNGYNRLIKSKMFMPGCIYNLATKSYVDTKTRLATKLFSDIMLNIDLRGTNIFKNTTSRIIDRILPDDSENTQTLYKDIQNAMLAAVRSTYFNSYALQNGIDIRELVSGNNTIVDRLNSIKIDILVDPQYEYLLSSDGTIDNYLLRMLIQGETHNINNDIENKPKVAQDTYPNAKFLSTLVFLDDDSVSSDEMTQAWEELLYDTEHPELQKFARDLILYAFITSGGNSSSNNLFKFIPNSWFINPDNTGYDNSYAAYISRTMSNYAEPGTDNAVFAPDFIDEIFENNWNDYRFVPQITLSDNGIIPFYAGKTGTTIEDGVMIGPNTDIPIMITAPIESSISRPYIKIRREYAKDSQRSIAMYKRIKFYIGETGDRALYVLVDVKGNQFGRNKIFEYGRRDSNVSEVRQQLKLNKDLFDFATFLGADVTDLKSVIRKLSSIIESKDDTEGVKALFKSKGISDDIFRALSKRITEQKEEQRTNELAALFQADDLSGELLFDDDANSANDVSANTYEAPTTESKEISSAEDVLSQLNEKQRNLHEDYSLTRFIKGRISAILSSINSARRSAGRVRISTKTETGNNINVSKQTESINNGKYIVISKGESDITDNEWNTLHEELFDTDKIIVKTRNNQLLVGSADYHNTSAEDEMIMGDNWKLNDYYKMITAGLPDDSKIALLEQELKDTDDVSDQLVIKGMIQRIMCGG